MAVGLNYWWTERLTVTAATVLTQYLQYNNTAITSTTTLYNTGAVESVEVPSGIIPDHGEMEYSRTYVSTATAVAFPLTTMYDSILQMTTKTTNNTQRFTNPI